MSIAFTRSMRSLHADNFRLSLAGMIVGALLLVGWGAWFVAAEGLARGLKAVFGKPSIFETMLRAIQAEGIECAVNLYRDLKKNEFDRYNFAESELNTLGLYLLANNQVGAAIEVLKQNLVTYPNAWKAYDGLGQAYRMSGDIVLADQNYEKAQWHRNHSQ